ncbi:MAG: ApaG domain [Akkermansiaceae bacterium]
MANSGEENYEEVEGLSVRVDDVIYMPSLDAPSEKPHPFVYFITIDNASVEQIRITGRKWIVREIEGEITVVEGDGVVGQTPTLDPGEDFSYNSYHITADDALVNGSFFGETGTGKKVRVRIPDFKLELPDWA